MISVLILTFNEEPNIYRCLRSVQWSDDVVVFDSFSTDRTVEIAKSLGARIVQRHWQDERAQRTAALQAGFKHSWVYNPDADEIATVELADEMQKVAGDGSRREVAYRVRFKHMFMGRWIRYSSLYPTWVVRLFRPERISFERSVNLRCIVDGPVGRLQHHFEHHSFNKGLSAWIDKHNRYSSGEALEALKAARGTAGWRRVVTADPVRRREALKDVAFRLPCRPALRFLFMYVLRRGFLDGWPGFAYCSLMAWYEFMIDLKIEELKRRETERARVRDSRLEDLTGPPGQR
jgi:glycosyltransferase involved in cell wall biosynthesis